MPKLLCKIANFGSSSMALRKLAMASSTWPLCAERTAQVDVGRSALRVELDGLAVTGDGLVQLAVELQREAEVDVGPRVIGPIADLFAQRGNGSLEERPGLTGAAATLEMITEGNQGQGVLGPAADQVAKDRLGLLVPPELLECVGQWIGQLGAEGASRGIRRDRLVPARRRHPQEQLAQSVLDPDVRRVNARGAAQHPHSGFHVASLGKRVPEQHQARRRPIRRLDTRRERANLLQKPCLVADCQGCADGVAQGVGVSGAGDRDKLGRILVFGLEAALPEGPVIHVRERRAAQRFGSGSAHGGPVVEGRDHRAAHRFRPGRDQGRCLLHVHSVNIDAGRAESVGIGGVSHLAVEVVHLGAPDLDQLVQEHAIALGGSGPGLDFGVKGRQLLSDGGVAALVQGRLGAFQALQRRLPAGEVFRVRHGLVAQAAPLP